MFKNWELLYIFLEVARAGSFRKAVNVLGLTQPTIGKKIDLLEDELGTKLFYRTRAGISLTGAGERLFTVSEEVERMSRRLSVDMDTGNLLTGRLRVAMTDGMAGYWLAPRLRRFHRDHPHVTLDIHVLDAGASVDLTKREADITVAYAYPEDPDVVVLEKSALVLVPVSSRAFVEEWGRPKDLDDVRNFPVVAHTLHYRKEGPMRPWAEMLERHPMVSYRTGSSMVLGNLIRMGIGLTLQPIGLLDREAEAVNLGLGIRIDLPFYLVCHRDVKDVPIVREMLRYLRDALFRDDGMGSPAKREAPPLQ